MQYPVSVARHSGTNTAGPKPISMKPVVYTLRGFGVNAPDE